MTAIFDIGTEQQNKSPCHSNASHHVWAQSDLPFRSKRGSKIFKMATVVAILDTGMEWFNVHGGQYYLEVTHSASILPNEVV